MELYKKLQKAEIRYMVDQNFYRGSIKQCTDKARGRMRRRLSKKDQVARPKRIGVPDGRGQLRNRKAKQRMRWDVYDDEVLTGAKAETKYADMEWSRRWRLFMTFPRVPSVPKDRRWGRETLTWRQCIAKFGSRYDTWTLMTWFKALPMTAPT